MTRKGTPPFILCAESRRQARLARPCCQESPVWTTCRAQEGTLTLRSSGGPAVSKVLSLQKCFLGPYCGVRPCVLGTPKRRGACRYLLDAGRFRRRYGCRSLHGICDGHSYRVQYIDYMPKHTRWILRAPPRRSFPLLECLLPHCGSTCIVSCTWRREGSFKVNGLSRDPQSDSSLRTHCHAEEMPASCEDFWGLFFEPTR